MDESDVQPSSIPIQKHCNIKMQDCNVNKLFSFKTYILGRKGIHFFPVHLPHMNINAYIHGVNTI